MMAPDETPTNLKPPRRRRWLRRALIAFAVVFALVIIAVLAGFWWLAQGPVELGFLEPRLDKTLLGTGDAPSVQIRNPVMTWGGWRRPLDLRAGPIRVIDPEGRSIVELEEASLGLAVSQLLRGRVSPTRIELERLWVQLVRTEDGRVAVGFEARDPSLPFRSHPARDRDRSDRTAADRPRDHRLEAARVARRTAAAAGAVFGHGGVASCSRRWAYPWLLRACGTG